MAQSVSNDALWEKLLEIERKFDGLSITQKIPVPQQEPAAIMPDFEANRQNISVLNGNIIAALNQISGMQKLLKYGVQSPKNNPDSYCDFRFFKVRKTALIITLLGLLVFLLTLCCMKQQSDYVLLNNGIYKQYITDMNEIKSINQECTEKKK